MPWRARWRPNWPRCWGKKWRWKTAPVPAVKLGPKPRPMAKDAIAYATSGKISAPHLARALFESAANFDMVHIPYRWAARP
jgi:hypothetical protein